ncbi:hypothetical protein GCM10020219_081020 [Nonomuraea dietziae]
MTAGRRWFDLDAASTSSIAGMSITVLDTYSAMRRILLAPVADRVDLLRSMLEPIRDMYRYYPGEADLVAIHLQTSGFPIDRDEERCLDALENSGGGRGLGADATRARRRSRRTSGGDAGAGGSGHHRAVRPRRSG